MSTERAVVAYRSAMLPQTFEQVVRFAEMIAKSAFCPQAFRNKPDECLAAITYGAEIGLSPMQALRGVALVNGQPSLYGDTLLAVCQAHPQWGGKEERIEGEGDKRVAICIVRRKGEPDTIGRFSIANAKAAKLLNKAGPWTEYTERMLMFRARGFALRDAFADALRGIITAEEARDYPHQGPDYAKEVNPRPVTASARRAAMQEAELVEVADEYGEVHTMLPGEVEQFMRDNPGAGVAAEEPAQEPEPAPQPKPNGNAAVAAKERGRQIAQAMEQAPDADALRKLYQRRAEEISGLPPKVRALVIDVYDAQLRRRDPNAEEFGAAKPTAPVNEFDADVADLEPTERGEAAAARQETLV